MALDRSATRTPFTVATARHTTDTKFHATFKIDAKLQVTPCNLHMQSTRKWKIAAPKFKITNTEKKCIHSAYMGCSSVSMP